MRRWKHGWIWFNMGWIWFNMIQYAYSELFWVVQKGSNLVRSLHCSLAICSFICVVCGNGFNVPPGPGSSGWYKYSSIPMDLSVPRPVSCHKTSIWLSIPTVYLLCDSVVFKCFFAFLLPVFCWYLRVMGRCLPGHWCPTGSDTSTRIGWRRMRIGTFGRALSRRLHCWPNPQIFFLVQTSSSPALRKSLHFFGGGTHI